MYISTICMDSNCVWSAVLQDKRATIASHTRGARARLTPITGPSGAAAPPLCEHQPVSEVLVKCELSVVLL